MGKACATYIPDRLTEGYGPSPEALAGLAEEGARLILTVDCGTTAERAIEAANEAGAEVIVIDHHQADEALPPAYAVLNPNRQDDLSGQGHLAAAGVVFLFLVATTRVAAPRGLLPTTRPSPICSACSISWRSPPCATWCRSRRRTAPSWPKG